MRTLRTFVLLIAVALLAGCGIRQTLVHITVPDSSVVVPGGTPIVVEPVADQRSAALDVQMDAAIRARNVGGVARGGSGILVQLQDGDVPQLMQRVVAQAVQNAGLRVVAADPSAMRVKVTVTRFDVQAPFNFWRAAGYAQQMLAEVDADVMVTDSRGTRTFHISGHGTNVYQVISQANWEIALNKAVADFSRQLQSQMVVAVGAE